MKILMLVNWKINYGDTIPCGIQPPDYYLKDEPYWFFRYFMNQADVDVIDISSFPGLENFEKNGIHFYIWQTLKAIPRLKYYDIIISHGMQSGVVLSLFRRFIKTKAKHIVFDIGSFNSAAESGFALKLMQYASKSIDGIIYHTSNQINYYKKYFPWIVNKSKFIKFGTDLDFFDVKNTSTSSDNDKYIICVGYSKRDWNTVVEAYKRLDTEIKLKLVGHVEENYKNIKGIEQIPFIPVKELINQIYNASFCVLPLESFNYSYGQMTLMQQMALEKCVIAAKVPSLIDYVKNGDTAIFYNAKNSEELASIIDKCIRDTEMCKQIGKAARMYLKNECNEKIMAREIESYIYEFL